ncbi:uncharacterized protein LOC130900358 [Diorhabda carinulata]|uniref:uncharacterized protein LOC130900358 n=1 Tax=Diorhabda carinulata TaxID=1163345 RepID=UPI0025A05A46|nr:uncharacterized protein LOC130900358 [Diorhabda carinulata]
MANPLKALNEHFLYNHRMVKALQQFLCPSDRRVISIWLDKLYDMDKNVEEMLIRSDYMWFILLMIQGKKILNPFTKLPPTTLVPLKKFVPLHTYEDVLIANEPTMSRINSSISDDSIFFSLDKKETSCGSFQL